MGSRLVVRELNMTRKACSTTKSLVFFIFLKSCSNLITRFALLCRRVSNCERTKKSIFVRSRTVVPPSWLVIVNVSKQGFTTQEPQEFLEQILYRLVEFARQKIMGAVIVVRN